MIKPILLPETTTNKQIWGQLHGASLALMLAEYGRLHTGVSVIITPNRIIANQLYLALQFFLNSEENAPELLHFPDWETLPYDPFSPHQDIISERLTTLHRLQQHPHAVVISAANTLMHRVCPTSFLNQSSFVLHEGQILDPLLFRNQLQTAGYHAVSNVLERGEFALRGSILDVFPMGSAFPFRIEWFDQRIEGLRRFDPETQRTIEKIPHVRILPAHEYQLDETGIACFRRAFRDAFSGNPSQSPVYKAVTEGQSFGGLEYYLPLFFDNVGTFFDYLPKANTTVFLMESIQTSAEHFWSEVSERYEQRKYDLSRPLLTPNTGFLTPIEFFTELNAFQQIRLSQSTSEKKRAFNFNVTPAPSLPIERHAPLPLHRLQDYLQTPNVRCIIVVESAGRREALLDLLKQIHISPKLQPSWSAFIHDTDPRIHITTGPLTEGAELNDAGILIIVESQLFGEHSTPQRTHAQKIVDPDLIIRDLAELNIGAPVVHLQFGVGRYLGLQTLDNQGCLNEFLILSYAGGDKIYVPVTTLHVISRYTGADSDHAPLHRLGSDQWQKEKKKAAEKIHDVAIELLDLYAKREAKPGHAYAFNEHEYQAFASAFPFTETADQQQAIQCIIQDMQSEKPMDRLICGDVGFGKTEVAMRAAFLAVQNGKQVCVLVPTTLLAGQHFETFQTRFADYPVQIELLSRFRSAKESERVLKNLQNGQTDIVIGTHKLFQKENLFKNLGLLIIDEEHRFGVKQKEHIKSLRTHVDILCMTATPIPRTLNMAMAGLRDISLIATPPAKRLAIKTFWQERRDSVIREALLREILRGGQVFFLHNNVQTIDRIVQDLQALVPEAQVRSAHGQMRERELERIMSDFYHHRFNVLVCTTIIETGIDIPTANTIIIDRADAFGLAQLHQLRGRVGRSHHQAYAYLLTPNEKSLTPDALKRLQAVVSLEDLGAGFTLATHDLEIRGAGELLGDGQSGHVQAIGFHLFMELLDRAVQDLKAGKIPELSAPMQQGPEIALKMSAIIPEDYVQDVHTRLILYKRIANATTEDALRALKIELIDRFGLLPPQTQQLFWVTELKHIAETMGIARISASGQTGVIEFTATPHIHTEALITLIQLHSTRYQLDGPSRLKCTLDGTNAETRVQEIKALLKKLRTSH